MHLTQYMLQFYTPQNDTTSTSVTILISAKANSLKKLTLK